MDAEHICTAERCPDGARYFVTMADQGRLWYLAGPYSTHVAALADVRKVREIASKNNPWSDFYAIGTVRSERVKPGSITAAGLL